jgi:hypothetical protein
MMLRYPNREELIKLTGPPVMQKECITGRRVVG